MHVSVMPPLKRSCPVKAMPLSVRTVCMRYGKAISTCRRNCAALAFVALKANADRKSTRLNSSHSQISYAVFCLKKKKKKTILAITITKQTTEEIEEQLKATAV